LHWGDRAVAFAATANASFAIEAKGVFHHMRSCPNRAQNKNCRKRNMRHTMQGVALMVAVGAQMLTFYSVLFA
jgi:hypothetical protein